MTGAPAAPALQGLSHLAFSVRDLPAATDFWARVLGFTVVTDTPGFAFLIRYDITTGVGLTTQDGTVAGSFTEHHVGLDHVALAVPDVPTLQQWAAWLAECGVPCSPVSRSDAGHHLNLRGPDHFPVELFVLDPAAAAQFGLDVATAPVARTHA